MASKPRSLPQSEQAAIVCSKKVPNILPLPLLHSRMKAQEFIFGYNSFMYDLSVTATRVLLSIASFSHAPTSLSLLPDS